MMRPARRACGRAGRYTLPVLLTMLAASAAATPAGAAVAPADSAFASGLADIERHLARLEKLGFAGVLAIARRGETVLARGYGLADRAAGRRWTPRTVSDIGSITKQFTAAAILRLEEQGRLRVEDSLARHLAAVPADKRAIRLHHLLSHTSGIVDLPGRGDWDPVDREAIVRLTMEAPLAHPVGERYQYSNAGYSLLGVVIEQVTGKSYEQALAELVLAPAGLRQTGYILPRWDPAAIAAGYRGGERWGTTLERPFAADGPYWILRANGGIHSTAEDMVRWAHALLDDRVLTAASRAKMWARHVDEGGGDSFYGYGWSLAPLADRDLVTHNGGNSIHFADLGIDPKERIVVFLQTNVVADFPAGNALLGDIGARFFAGTAMPELPDVDPQADLAPYAGSYTGDDGGRIEVEAAGGTLALVTHRPEDHARLYSPAGADLATLAGHSAALQRIMEAWLRRDYGPLAEAYGGRTTLATLRARSEERRRGDEERLGELQAIVVVGTTATREGAMTLLRLEFARGREYRRYFWDREGALRGSSPSRVGPPARFFPLVGGGFAAYEPGDEARRIAFARGPDGRMTLTIGAGDGTRTLRR